jgi:hypothetical protein
VALWCMNTTLYIHNEVTMSVLTETLPVQTMHLAFKTSSRLSDVQHMAASVYGQHTSSLYLLRCMLRGNVDQLLVKVWGRGKLGSERGCQVRGDPISGVPPPTGSRTDR